MTWDFNKFGDARRHLNNFKRTNIKNLCYFILFV